MKAGWIVLGVLWCSTLQAMETPERATVNYQQVPQTYMAEGVVEAVRQATVAAQIGGRIVEVNFNVGDVVQQGEVLVKIDERAVREAVSGSEAQVKLAKARLDEVKADLERQRQLFQQKFISQAGLDSAEAAYKSALAAYNVARAGSGAATTTHSYATVVAPYSGVVSAVHVEAGDTVMPGKPLMSGFDPADLRVLATIPQAKWNAVRNGAGVQVEIPALNQWVAPRAVTLLPVADARSLTAGVRLTLPASLPGVVPGLFARAHFVTGEKCALVVPTAAVLRRSEVTAVYVLDDRGVPQLRQVRLGDAAGDAGMEVLAGLKAGEQVALNPVRAGVQANTQHTGAQQTGAQQADAQQADARQ